jgi:hypothetical protein
VRKQKLEPYAEEKFTVSAIQGHQVTLTRVDGTTRVANVQDHEVFSERPPVITDVYEWVQELARQKLREKPRGLFDDSFGSEEESDAENDTDSQEANVESVEERQDQGRPNTKGVPDRVIDYYKNAEGQQHVQLGYAGRPTNYKAKSWIEIPSPEASALPHLQKWLKEYKSAKVYGPYTQDLVDAKSVTAKEKKRRDQRSRAKRDERDEAKQKKMLQKLRADTVVRRR